MACRASSARDPAPAEIKRRCAEIRDMWSEMTHRVRAGYGRNYEEVYENNAWTPPRFSSLELELDSGWDW